MTRHTARARHVDIYDDDEVLVERRRARRWERRAKRRRQVLLRARDELDQIANTLEALITAQASTPRSLRRLLDRIDALADSIDAHATDDTSPASTDNHR
ncbi:hypothetical protein QSU92_01155 [Microbacterium sp. ET2]|uniref:hypothetical protein n=1 Tax=Microbacterium albipurpureum TaxID=3050384 RepID=UPI00259D1FDF|nr:hypothetical protein [Microbacterium sp. ET2 (Ac-2212)]WJL95864.1 hypothetical protein QSU92_01155 [Microbacterium sp. ET2 (Ac-2212)]